jgi:hypothetical protein
MNISLISGVAFIALTAGFLLGSLGKTFEITISWIEIVTIIVILIIIFIHGYKAKEVRKCETLREDVKGDS